ncbi:MAG: thymidine phosphorylase [Candidatus Dormibacteria bacterium]
MRFADSPLRAVELIRAKREGHALDAAAIDQLFSSYLRYEVGDEQMSALLMAICWRGMTAPEVAAWTGAMVRSGARLDLSSLSSPTVDKHSTGGVGDKVSLILAPLVAACGAAVPQMSGRGLGHTGGTLDKLEVIPGWRSDLTADEMLHILAEVGCVICSSGPELAPADRRLYALRDVTGTVESIPLIASSIMSKKVAEGTGALLLDVKVGSGAFMPDHESARTLAETMMGLGETYGVRTSALLTAMDAPLGRAVGNAVEVVEALDVLRGGGPADIRELVLAEAKEMLALAGTAADPEAALDDGRALERFRAMVSAQGGDPDAPLPVGAPLATVRAEKSGFLRRLDARSIGVCVWRLGAGRSRAGEPVSATAGILCLAKPGEMVEAGQPILNLVGDDPNRLEAAMQALVGAIDIGADPGPAPPLVLERLGRASQPPLCPSPTPEEKAHAGGEPGIRPRLCRRRQNARPAHRVRAAPSAQAPRWSPAVRRDQRLPRTRSRGPSLRPAGARHRPAAPFTMGVPADAAAGAPGSGRGRPDDTDGRRPRAGA